MPHTINGIAYGAATEIKKLSQVPQLVPHTYHGKEAQPTRYGSFIATVVNEEDEEQYKVYMPKYIIEQAYPGRGFIYCGKIKKTDRSGHEYHKIEWEEEVFV